MDTTQLRQDFPAFSDVTTFPESAVKFWLTLAESTLDSCLWSTWYTLGLELFAAHHLVLAARDKRTVDNGGIPGGVQGVQTSKAVDKVSAGMDAKSVTLSDADYWNMTTYGIQFYRMARQLGAGGLQSGAGGSMPGIPVPGSIQT